MAENEVSSGLPSVEWTKLLIDEFVADETNPYHSYYISARAFAITIGLDGSIYIGGEAYGDLDGETNSGSTDAFISKFNPDGTKDWTKLIGSTESECAYTLTTGLDGSNHAP